MRLLRVLPAEAPAVVVLGALLALADEEEEEEDSVGARSPATAGEEGAAWVLFRLPGVPRAAFATARARERDAEALVAWLDAFFAAPAASEGGGGGDDGDERRAVQAVCVGRERRKRWLCLAFHCRACGGTRADVVGGRVLAVSWRQEVASLRVSLLPRGHRAGGVARTPCMCAQGSD